MRRAPTALFVAVGLTIAARASAAETPVVVVLPECAASPIAADAFLGSLKVELAGDARACCTRLLVPPDGASATAAAAATTTLDIQPCGGTPNLVRVRVSDGRGGVALDREVALGDVSPEARPRALALAVAELVRAAATPAPVTTAAPPPPPTPPANPEPRDGWIPVVGFSVRTHVSGNITLWGFHAALELAEGAWQAAVEGYVESGNPHVALGTVDTTFAGGALEAGRRFHPGKTIVDLGVIGGLGVVHMGGVSAAPGSVTSSGLGLEATAGGRAAFDFWRIPHDRARLRLVLEGGAVVHGVEATVNGQNAAGLTGAYLMAGLAAALGPF
ncbi:MAG TPA: hypothetical protein VLT58_06140 [Polyangia bacterium]|nr:hypothetical protein [Polyangia bacterium]